MFPFGTVLTWFDHLTTKHTFHSRLLKQKYTVSVPRIEELVYELCCQLNKALEVMSYKSLNYQYTLDTIRYISYVTTYCTLCAWWMLMSSIDNTRVMHECTATGWASFVICPGKEWLVLEHADAWVNDSLANAAVTPETIDHIQKRNHITSTQMNQTS